MLKKLTQKDLTLTNKLWGWERLIVNNDTYCGKILRVVPGFQSSIHYHKNKTETFLAQEGLLELELWDDIVSVGEFTEDLSRLKGPSQRVILWPGDSITLPPCTPHRFSAAGSHEVAVFYEFSSHDDPEDSYRLEPSGPKVGREMSK